MDRRSFLNGIILASIATACGRPATRSTARRVAITIDDPQTLETSLLDARGRDEAILSALDSAKVSAVLYVCGKRVDSTEGRELLKRWNDAGHVIANHSWSHLFYHSDRITPDAYIEDLEHGETIISPLPRFQRLFRFPYLKEGNTLEKRNRMREYLAGHGYRNGHVSIDASDWYVDDRLRKRLASDPSADTTPYRDYYLEHIHQRAEYYDGLSTAVLGRSIPHVLLIHHSLLNALFLGDLIEMFRSRGWEVIGAAEAYDDPVYTLAPDVVPAGESLLWSLATESGRFADRLRYPAEDGRYEEAEMNRRGL